MSSSVLKVIFLDVDGVLTTEECEDAPPEGGEDSHHFVYSRTSRVPLVRRCLALLGDLVTRTGAGLVISSSWRLQPGLLAFLTESLDELEGGGGVLGVTGDRLGVFHGGGRGEEVRDWLELRGQPVRSSVCSFSALENLGSFTLVLLLTLVLALLLISDPGL